MGGNLRLIGGGGAAASLPVLQFFEDIGISVTEGYDCDDGSDDDDDDGDECDEYDDEGGRVMMISMMREGDKVTDDER